MRTKTLESWDVFIQNSNLSISNTSAFVLGIREERSGNKGKTRLLLEGFNGERKYIYAVKGKTKKTIPIDDIGCFLADKKYTEVLYLGGKVSIDESLKSLEEKLCGDGGDFVRIHRNALVKTNMITGTDKYYVVGETIADVRRDIPNFQPSNSKHDFPIDIPVVELNGGLKLQISRRYASSVAEILKNKSINKN